MAIYRMVHQSFWSDRKIMNDFTPEDKFFYLYLLTNPSTNICGCYEISERQVSLDTGYNIDTVKRLIERMQNYHNVIRFDDVTGEVLIMNWGKYNWTKSPKLINSVKQVCSHIKNKSFRKYVSDCIHILTGTESDTETDTDTDTDVSIGYTYPINTVLNECDVTVTHDNAAEKEKNKKKNKKEYFANPEINSEFLEFIKMRKQMKSAMTDRAIELAISKINKLSGGNDSTALAIIKQSIERGWKGFFPLEESKAQNQAKNNKFNNFEQRSYDFAELERKLLGGA